MSNAGSRDAAAVEWQGSSYSGHEPMYACLYLPPHSHSMTRPASDATQALVHLAHEYSPRIELQGQQLGSPREIGATLRS